MRKINIFRFSKGVQDVYNKTVSYLRSNHGSPKIRKGEEVIKNQQENNSMNIDLLLEDEIEKYNRLKSQKQKEARFMFEEETKKMKMFEKMKDREEKLLEIKQKTAQDKVLKAFRRKNNNIKNR